MSPESYDGNPESSTLRHGARYVRVPSLYLPEGRGLGPQCFRLQMQSGVGGGLWS